MIKNDFFQKKFKFRLFISNYIKKTPGPMKVWNSPPPNSRDTAILLNGWILPIGGASAVEGLLSTGPTPSSFLIFRSVWANLVGPLAHRYDSLIFMILVL